MGKLFNRKFIAVLVTLTMIFSCVGIAFADTGNAADTAAKESIFIDLSEIAALEYPAPLANTPAVMLDGEYIDFADAVPQNINGRVMVPCRAVLEAMGATVGFDGAKKEITATIGDRKISFCAGSDQLTVMDNGVVTETVTMDVAPFIEASTSRTFVPSRFVFEAFDFSVAWDSEYKTVIIMDFETIIDQIAEEFSILGLMLNTEDIDLSKAYKTVGDMGLQLTLDGNFMSQITEGQVTNPITIGVSADVDGVSEGMTAEMMMEMTVDIGDFMDIMGLTGTPDGDVITDMISDMNMDIKMDTKNIYIKMPVLDALVLGANATAQTENWYQMSLEEVYGMYDDMGLDMNAMIKEVQNIKNFEDYLRYFINMLDDNMTIDTYTDIKAILTVCKEIIGDDAFVTRTSGNTAVHTLCFDMNSIANLIKKIDPSITDAEIAAELGSDIDFGFDLTINEKDSKLADYDFVMDFEVVDTMTMSMDATGNMLDEDMTIVLSLQGIGDVVMTVSASNSVTNEKPNLTIPVNANVVNFMDLLGY